MSTASDIRQILEVSLRRTSFDKHSEAIRKFFEDPIFHVQFERMILAKRYDASSLAELFHPLYAGLYNLDVREWLQEILVYTMSLNFSGFSERVLSEHIPYHRIFLDCLRFVNELELASMDGGMLEYPMELLSEEEEQLPDIHPEYFTFKREFFDNFVYEMMKIDLSVRGYNTIQHVIDVNALAMHIARQLHAVGVPIDLGLVAGSTLCHDVGKYGVKGDESRRIAYYHYFYTWEWYAHRNLEKMGNIATNHSTWDLELYNLTIEALLLIYADFRVKNIRDENGVDTMRMISLQESYQVILDKLDNVDEAKRNRYTRVYARLVDLEIYLKRLGISVTPGEPAPAPTKEPARHFALLKGEDVIRNIIDFSIEHNLNVMHRFSRDDSFNQLMEDVRGESDKLTLRQYIDLLYEYSSYFTLKQKKMLMQFLFELLLADADDIRRDAGRLIGYLLANYDDDYKKEIPPSVTYDTLHGTKAYDDLMQSILFPETNLLDHKVQLQYNLLSIHKELFRQADTTHSPYLEQFLHVLGRADQLPEDTLLILAKCVLFVPLEQLTAGELRRVEQFILRLLDTGSEELTLVVLDLIRQREDVFLAAPSVRETVETLVREVQDCPKLAKSYLLYVLAQSLQESPEIPSALAACFENPEDSVSGLLLNNLKSATPWIVKRVNIDLLLMAANANRNILFHVAMHYCNLLKVSEYDLVRERAGEALVSLVTQMAPEEVNDIAVELLRGLEMNNYNFVRLIPQYLGEILLYLPPHELNEILDDFDIKIKTANMEALHAILHTIGRSLEMYDSYMDKVQEDPKSHNERRNRMLGLLISVISSPKALVHTEAFAVLSRYIFQSSVIYPETQAYYTRQYGKKLLTMLTTQEAEFTYMSNAYALNQMYKCITEYQMRNGEIIVPNQKKIAFFPGTFDPFSNGHLAICRDVRDMGYEVYISIDEFSWSKKPLPYFTRRKIVEMSISAERNVYIFPSDIPINIANDENIRRLETLFDDREVTMMVGADVVQNASAYRKQTRITELPHILYLRSAQVNEETEQSLVKRLSGPHQLLALDMDLQFISSTLIRDSVDNNRDINHLVNPMVRDFIMEHKLYKRDEPFKTMIMQSQYTLRADKTLTQNDLDFISQIAKEDIRIHIREEALTILRFYSSQTEELVAVALYEHIEIIDLYHYFEHIPTISAIREGTRGPIAYLHGIFLSRRFTYLREELVNEAFAHIVSNNYDNMLFTNKMRYNKEYTDLLVQSGFRFVARDDAFDTMLVDTSRPVTLNLDIEKYIKKPYNKHPSVVQRIRENRKRLKEALSELFPNTLILSFTRDMINQKLIERITKYNEVPSVQQSPRTLGPYLCVPFGEHLHGEIVPNTITKTIHTEKMFDAQIKNFTITAFPHYLPLADQCKTIESFDRPVLLVDDLLHKGYRIRVVKPALEAQNVQIQKLFVGILSMKGLEIAMAGDLDVDYSYFVPRLRYWFKESDLCPYIGGDMVDTPLRNGTLIPSINLILPYVSPAFLKEGTNEEIYGLSEVSLENALQLFRELERVYLEQNGKTVAMKDIFDVLHYPRIPDYKGLEDMDMMVSHSIQHDLNLLHRIKASVLREEQPDA